VPELTGEGRGVTEAEGRKTLEEAAAKEPCGVLAAEVPGIG